MKQRSKVTPKAIEAGQVWQMPESNIQITLLGKTLVHYKHIKPGAVRVPTSLINKTALEQFLLKKKAVLVQA